MNTIIYMVRHGAYQNPDGIVPGRMPGFHLSEDGKATIKKVGKFFKDRPIDHVYTSPLERTFETANLISEDLPGIKITHVYDLIEVDAKPWQALKLEELYTNSSYEAFISDPRSDKVPENLHQMASRMKNFVLSLCQKHAGGEVICVSHDYPILALLLSLEGKPLEMMKSYNASMGSITTLVFNEKCDLLEASYTELQ